MKRDNEGLNLFWGLLALFALIILFMWLFTKVPTQ